MNSNLKKTNQNPTNITNDDVSKPSDLMKSPIEKAFDDNAKKLKNKDFKKNVEFPSISKYRYEKPFVPFMVYKSCTYSTHIKENSLIVKYKASFEAIRARYIRFISDINNSLKDELYIAITIKCYNGHVVKDILLKNSAKFEEKEFQRALSARSNHAMANFTPAEYKTFMQMFVLPLLNTEYRLYKNAGLIAPQTFLCKNCLIYKGCKYWADDEGFIKHPEEDCYIKISDEFEYIPPILSESSKSGKVVANDLLQNYYETLGENRYLHLFILGHMAMGLHYKAFTKLKLGAPIPIVCGTSCAGKSVTTNNGISLFGLSDELMMAGDTSLYGAEGTANAFIGVTINTDDLSEEILESSRFRSNIKKAFKSSPRFRRKNHGQNSDKVQINSQLCYSSNGALPELKESITRANVYSFVKSSIDTENFQYFPENIENCKELSLILVELLKYSHDDAFNLHKKLLNKLKEKSVEKVDSRILHNVAYMWTGIAMLEEIADFQIPNLENAILDYTKMLNNKVKVLPTPIDIFLSGLLIMKNQEIIRKEHDYILVQPEDSEYGYIELRFHKETLFNIYNNFFRYDKTYKLNRQILWEHLSNDDRAIRDISQRYRNDNGKKGKSQTFCLLNITDWDEVFEFAGTEIIDVPEPMSYEELARNVRNCNSL